MTEVQAKQISIIAAQLMDRSNCVAIYEIDIDNSVFHTYKHVTTVDLETLAKIAWNTWGFAKSSQRDRDLAIDEYCRRTVDPSVRNFPRLNVPSTYRD